MTYSMNELHGLLQKAGVGAGFPPGHADAIAQAGIWLAQRRFPVCDIVAKAFDLGMTELRLANIAGGVAFKDARAATAGLAALELLLAKQVGFGVVLQDLDDPVLLLGLTGVTAQAHNVAFNVSCAALSYDATWPGNVIVDEFVIPVAGELVMTQTEKTQPQSGIRLASRYDPSAVADGGRDSLVNLAANTYVPATDHSRIKGAGAGLTDND